MMPPHGRGRFVVIGDYAGGIGDVDGGGQEDGAGPQGQGGRTAGEGRATCVVRCGTVGIASVEPVASGGKGGVVFLSSVGRSRG